jgi:hypothetical protein
MGQGMSQVSGGRPRKGWVGHGLSQVSTRNDGWDSLCLSLNGLMRQSLSRERRELLRGGDGFRQGIQAGGNTGGQSIPSVCR